MQGYTLEGPSSALQHRRAMQVRSQLVLATSHTSSRSRKPAPSPSRTRPSHSALSLRAGGRAVGRGGAG